MITARLLKFTGRCTRYEIISRSLGININIIIRLYLALYYDKLMSGADQSSLGLNLNLYKFILRTFFCNQNFNKSVANSKTLKVAPQKKY